MPAWDPHVRLDYVFVPQAFRDRIVRCEVVRDHDAAKASDPSSGRRRPCDRLTLFGLDGAGGLAALAGRAVGFRFSLTKRPLLCVLGQREPARGEPGYVGAGGPATRASPTFKRGLDSCHDYYVPTQSKVTPRSGRPNQPLPPTGRPASGQIVRINAGQSHGFIRAADNREVFFHRSDTTWGTFNQLLVGDTVAFELIEDRVSGPRATAVRKGGRPR